MTNGEALGRAEVLAYAAELLDPPLPTPPQTLPIETPEPLSDIERSSVR